ncbi:MAG: DUF364 domain-containing protein [Bacteroidota bacterium]
MPDNYDILEQLFEKAKGIKPISDAQFTFGEKYVAAMINGGQIGVCATLNVKVHQSHISNIDFSKAEYRVVANAFANASLNYLSKPDGYGDIFDVVDFTRFANPVMIGYFGSLVQKLQGKGVSPVVFDIDQHDAPVLPMEKQHEYLTQADCVILTSTSLGNGTFGGIAKAVSPKCSIYMLGPSTPLDDLMFTIPQVKGLFGSIFPVNNTETLSLIAQGYGTRGFMHTMRKVYRVKT